MTGNQKGLPVSRSYLKNKKTGTMRITMTAKTDQHMADAERWRGLLDMAAFQLEQTAEVEVYEGIRRTIQDGRKVEKEQDCVWDSDPHD